jgi:hypothetical protein
MLPQYWDVSAPSIPIPLRFNPAHPKLLTHRLRDQMNQLSLYWLVYLEYIFSESEYTCGMNTITASSWRRVIATLIYERQWS